jgi:hypothetical protein
MPRVPRPATTRRSEHWLRILINQFPTILRQELQIYPWALHEEITWLSPLADDDYAEYSDGAFLQRLGVEPQAPLSEFWPPGGPRWDGLGMTSGNKRLLLETKAYVEELVTEPSQASEDSLRLIQQSLDEAKVFLNARPPLDWSKLFYQYTNRLAHLYYLRERNGIDAYLLGIYFVGAPDVPEPSTVGEWRAALRLLRRCLGIHNHRLSPFCADIFIDVSALGDPDISMLE